MPRNATKSHEMSQKVTKCQKKGRNVIKRHDISQKVTKTQKKDKMS